MKLKNIITKHFFGFFISIVIAFILFFGEHSLWSLLKYHHQEKKLKQEIAAYRDSIANYESQMDALEGDAESLERYAREQLLMKRPNEDVYVIK